MMMALSNQLAAAFRCASAGAAAKAAAVPASMVLRSICISVPLPIMLVVGRSICESTGRMATDPARITTPERTAEDVDQALRPKSLDEFIGQQAARENLRVFVHAAKARGEALDHVLLHGPPGLGKTTLAGILAREMGVGF